MSGRETDVLVIGAGIVGAALADRLSAERLRVTVVDAGVVGGGATAAGMGHVVVMDDSEAQFALTQYSRRLWMECAALLPAGCEYQGRGTLWVAADDEEMFAVYQKREYLESRGVAASVLNDGELAREEPQLRAGLAGALLVPEDGVLYPPVAAKFYLQRALGRGAVYVPGAEVVSVGVGGPVGDKTVTLASGTRLHAGAVIHAAGTAVAHLPVALPVAPRKGHLAITDRAPGALRHQIVELGYLKSAHGHDAESVACNLQPRVTGQILIGSSRQYGVEDAAVEPRMLARMLRRAVEYMPGLAAMPVIRTWTGFRSATPDGLPLIGPVEGFDGLWVATGHEGLGITTSLGTAAILTDLFLGREPAIAAEAYRPGRFAGRGANA